MGRVYCLFIILVLFQSCTTKQTGNADRRIADNRYDSEQPARSISKELAFVSNTVRKLNVVAFYMTYELPPGAITEKSKLSRGNLILKATATHVSNQSVTGTATVIYNKEKLVGMLTCNHVVDFPDTVIESYRSSVQGFRTVSVKMKQRNFVMGMPVGEEVEIVAADKNNDIALLKQQIEVAGANVKVLDFPLGSNKYFDWGSRVWIVGYPLGNLMVTGAIVSKPGKKGDSRFLTDAVFNQGISGAPVIAIRDGVPNFELVGMAASSSAKSIYYLKPENPEKFRQSDEPFVGDVVLAHERMINYGVTYSVTIDEIRRFLLSNATKLEQEGFKTEWFFK
jgi:S1-C subfamily serine protease